MPNARSTIATYVHRKLRTQARANSAFTSLGFWLSRQSASCTASSASANIWSRFFGSSSVA